MSSWRLYIYLELSAVIESTRISEIKKSMTVEKNSHGIISDRTCIEEETPLWEFETMLLEKWKENKSSSLSLKDRE